MAVVLHVSYGGGPAAEKRFLLDEPVMRLKERMTVQFGCDSETISLELRDAGGALVRVLAPDGLTLYDAGAADGMQLVVRDSAAARTVAAYHDVSRVEKVTIDEDAYARRDVSGRKFREQMIARRAAAAPPPGETVEEAPWAGEVGQRCEVDPGGRRGVVRFIGEVRGLKEGVWVGVELDEPLGKNDGVVKGVRLFECAPNHGVLVRPSQCACGDFPPLPGYCD